MPTSKASAPRPRDLIAYAKAGNAKGVERLLAAGADTAATDKYGMAPLAHAVAKGSLACVSRLVAAGADLDARCHGGATAACLAAAAGSLDCLCLLIQAGADANAADEQGKTPAMAAAGNGRLSCLRALLGAGVDIEARDSRGMGAAMWACGGGHGDCLAALMGAGADVRGRDVHGWTLLMRASEAEGGAACVRLLLGAGADVHERDFHGRSAISVACASPAGLMESLAELIRGGASVDDADNQGATPLMRAAATFDDGLVGMLIDAGADIDAKDGSGLAALDYARHNPKAAARIEAIFRARAEALCMAGASRRAQSAKSSPRV